MASTSEEEQLKAEIAKLSGAIQTHKQQGFHQPTYQAYGVPSDGWIKRKSTHNMSLVSTSTFQRTEPARLAAMEATRKAKAEAKSSSSKQPLKPKGAKSSVRRGDNMGEVVIDGVVFEFDPSGTKLVKKPIQPPSDTPTSSAAPEAVPLKTSINGQSYIRTKRGNLISSALLAKRKTQREASAKMGRLNTMVGQISAIQATRNAGTKGSKTLDVKKARTLCTFFTRTGSCKRGLSCPYLHDSGKIALCPKVLRPAGCSLPKGTCPLSHGVRPERVPHCVHFLRLGRCRNGDECLYTHTELPDGAQTKICREFSEYGWCERGKGCQERHTYECPDFVEKGKCERKGCKLVHVLRAQPAMEEGGMQDGELFMRDDAAAAEPSDEEETRGKRKRPLMQTELDDDQLLPDEDDGEEDDEQVNFADMGESRRAKRRKAKAFTQQKDFISFDDEDGEEEEEEEAESEEEEVSEDEDEDENQDEVDVASVHSEDFELSDGEDEEVEQEDEEEEADEHESAKLHADHQHRLDRDEADDDDLVDRDL
uniref:C3H1-type domain-containing protein n=1 Tax=Kalmanozyma brasiliensis (strain GHG001) TaxID=1365824 RepID=V5EXH2_KALBG